MDHESIETARREITKEIAEGFKQTAYDLTWEITESSIEEGTDW